MSEPLYKVSELLPRRLRPIFEQLTDGLYCDKQSYRTLQRLALFLCEIDKHAGTPTIKAVMRRIERIESSDTHVN